MHAGGDIHDRDGALGDVLGYLNFSAGAPDPKFLAGLDRLYRAAAHDALAAKSPPPSPLDVLRGQLSAGLDRLKQAGGPFDDDRQALAVLRLLFDDLPPANRQFHRDLLFHQSDVELFRPLFLGRAAEAILAQAAPWDQTERILQGAIAALNDFVGYRPVAILENERRSDPYAHEWVRPIPLYVAGACVGEGPYASLVEAALDILRRTDGEILSRAWFNPALVEELALDPRAYDFDHPVNKRPNYHFGQWDPHRIDNRGRYRRFVLQQVTLDALLMRVDDHQGERKQEKLFEAAAVLAGTMLMASGVTGGGPDSHDSTVTLGELVKHIAAYRDDFYHQLLAGVEGPHGKRLRSEATKLKQPFGGARQHINQELARRRSIQMQRVHLAQLYARMGHPRAALRQVNGVRVASARMLSEMYCQLTAGHHAIEGKRLGQVVDHLHKVEDLLQRGIECGALVDPWNILGFGGNFSLFPAVANSIRDYRVDDLIDVVEQSFVLCSRAWSEAAAIDDAQLESSLSAVFSRLANWWDQFAAWTVGGVRQLVGKEEEVSTNLVAGALNAWHKAGAAAGDIGFWRMFVEQFDSPRAFATVIEALLEKHDYVASMALLMQWLSQADAIELDDGDDSFHRVAVRWMRGVRSIGKPDAAANHPERPAADETWPLVQKFFAFLEANAQVHWEVPTLELTSTNGGEHPPGQWSDAPGDDADADEDDEFLFSAAYDEMTYRDSTGDGVEADMLEEGSAPGQFELEAESDRLADRLGFLFTLARLWQTAALGWTAQENGEKQIAAFDAWRHQAETNLDRLSALLTAVHQYRIPVASSSQESLLEYDRHRMVKDALVERIVAACVEMSQAARYLRAAGSEADVDEPAAAVLRAILRRRTGDVRHLIPPLLESLKQEPWLYVPLARGGDPRRIVRVRALQQTVWELAGWLPKLGMVRETRLLLSVVQARETENPPGPGAVTEFDRLFENAHKAIAECIVASASSWEAASIREAIPRPIDEMLVESLQQMTENQLQLWLVHSRTLRLSVVERFTADRPWTELVAFIEQYGHDLFTQHFLNLGNLRAILHQGVDRWLAWAEQMEHPDAPLVVLDVAEGRLPRAKAVKLLSLVFESLIEHYAEYRDYNATTTQSDRGELLYTLLDFLRLQVSYDRITWNLRPVTMVHEVLVRQGRSESAALWRAALAERTTEVADAHLTQLKKLDKKYAMRLPTVSDHLAERFVRSLVIDRIRALVRPAMEEAEDPAGSEGERFSLLEREVEAIAGQPSGAGLDTPGWLEALEEEVSQVRSETCGGGPRRAESPIDQVLLSWDEIQEQIGD